MIFIEKYIIPLVLAISIAFVTGGWTFYLAVRDLTALVNQHDASIKTIQADVQQLRNSTVTQSQLLETLKRVEQQLEIVLLKAKINTGKVKLE